MRIKTAMDDSALAEIDVIYRIYVSLQLVSLQKVY